MRKNEICASLSLDTHLHRHGIGSAKRRSRYPGVTSSIIAPAHFSGCGYENCNTGSNAPPDNRDCGPMHSCFIWVAAC